MEVAISVVSGTYNRLPHLKRMVASVRKSVKDLPYEIILADGGSGDGTIEWCKEQPDIVLIQQGELLGAVLAFNAACAKAKGDYVVILNDDIEVRKDTIWRSWQYMQRHSEVGQVAYCNYPVRKAPEPRSAYSKSYGYLYGQCCMTRKWLGDWAGWWGEKYHTYGGDSHLGMRMWELGWAVHAVDGCGITDHVVEDDLRKRNRKLLRPAGPGTSHKDTEEFIRQWNGRLPKHNDWIPVPTRGLAYKAAHGTLRSLRFRFVYPGAQMRMAQYNAFKRLGPTWHYDQCELIKQHGVDRFQNDVMDIVSSLHPDLVMFQAHGSGNIQPGTVQKLRERFPDVYFTNFDGDFHLNLSSFHFEIAKAVHLQLLISPDLFPVYAEHGVHSVCWSSTAYENEYAEVERSDEPQGPDIVFLVNKTPTRSFPDAPLREATVKALFESGLDVKIYGTGWGHLGIHAKSTSRLDERKRNAQVYADAKMTVSVSQTHDLYGYSSNRIFFAGATGCPILQKRFVGMEDIGYVDGETIIVWDTVPEMLEKARYYLAHPDEREGIGRRCQEMTLERHSYDVRIRQLILMLEGL